VHWEQLQETKQRKMVEGNVWNLTSRADAMYQKYSKVGC